MSAKSRYLLDRTTQTGSKARGFDVCARRGAIQTPSARRLGLTSLRGLDFLGMLTNTEQNQLTRMYALSRYDAFLIIEDR